MKSSANVNLQMRLTSDTIEIVVKLAVFFNDTEKVYAWLTVKNPGLGGISPLMLINTGRAHKVLQFIVDAQEGNLP